MYRDAGCFHRDPRSLSRDAGSSSRDATSSSRDPRSLPRDPGSSSRDATSSSRDPSSFSRDATSLSRDPRSLSRDASSLSRGPIIRSADASNPSPQASRTSRQPAGKNARHHGSLRDKADCARARWQSFLLRADGTATAKSERAPQRCAPNKQKGASANLPMSSPP
jgi:hypothetical protein